ncbi:fimbrial protein [Cupriavidus sp. NPDC089707]|uniref:fimbrial protein n=1 Tax=Cupriavidus sp. NPDC089707 TaxID=3363963 RepID=UPI00380B7233
MKTKLLSALIIGGAVIASQGAFAADGTITFNGMLTAQTCTINGGTGKDFTVTLPTVSTSTLNGDGTVAGRTPFTISLTNCSPASGAATTFFEAGPTTDLTTGRLIVADGGATKVQIELLNKNFTPIQAGFAAASQNDVPVSLSSGAADLQYYAQYHATGVATAGAANSSVIYTIAYQ